MVKRRAGSQTGSLTPDRSEKKSKINPIHLFIEGMKHIVGKLLTRATTLLQTAFQLEVCSQSYGAPKSWESQLGRFWDSHLGVLEQKAIWMWGSWPTTKYTIRRKVVVSPKSRLWSVLCVCVTRGLSQHQRCSNYALTTLCGFCASPCE